jgi:hypothetical protein
MSYPVPEPPLPEQTPHYGLSSLGRGAESWTEFENGGSLPDAAINFWMLDRIIWSLQQQINDLSSFSGVENGKLDCGTW